jgi:ABC-type methionine transport system permease subunit
MDGKIIGFRGQKVPTATGADPEIVQWLEDVLEQAKRGEIEALLAVTVHGNDFVRTQVINNRGRRHELAASVVYLIHDIGKP